MKVMRTYLLFALFLMPGILHSQTIYLFDYKENDHGTILPKKGLFFLRPDGSGFLRVRFINANREDVLLGYDLNQDVLLNTDQTEDTIHTLIRAINTEVFTGIFDRNQPGPVFLFEKKTGHSYFEPKGISSAGNPIMVDSAAEFHSVPLEGTTVTKEVFSNFFFEDETFMEQYFQSKSKDISKAEKSMKLHLIIIADTTEQVIGKSCAMDYHRTYSTYKDLANYLGCQFHFVGLAGKTFTKSDVVSQLKLLKPSTQDMVVFYYTGHGFRKPDDARRFPYLDLRSRNGQSFLVETLNMEDIYTIIKKKNARMNLVMSDCCNAYVGAENVKATPPFVTKSLPQEYYLENVRSLFLKPKISILATAADSTQKATSNDLCGGFFSYFFKQSLESGCSQSTVSPTWYGIFNSTKTQTIFKAQHTYCDRPFIPSNICNQSPCYKIEQ